LNALQSRLSRYNSMLNPEERTQLFENIKPICDSWWSLSAEVFNLHRMFGQKEKNSDHQANSKDEAANDLMFQQTSQLIWRSQILNVVIVGLVVIFILLINNGNELEERMVK
jgi:hypothetical protein